MQLPQIAEVPLYGRTAAEIVYESLHADANLMIIGMLAMLCGFVVAAVGGVGAIHGLFRLGDGACDEPCPPGTPPRAENL